MQKSVAFSSVSSLVAPAGQLLAAPLLIENLGEEKYGTLLILNTIVSLSGISTFGFGEALAKASAEQLKDKNLEKLIYASKTVFFFYVIIGFACIAFSILFSHSIGSFLGINSGAFEEKSLLLSAAQFAIRLFQSAIDSICRGSRRFDLEGTSVFLFGILSPTSQILISKYSPDIGNIQVGGFAVAILVLLVSIFRLSTVFRTVKWILPGPSRIGLEQVGTFGLFSWLQTFEGVISTNADRIIIARCFGTEKVAQYAIMFQFVQVISILVSKAFYYVFPEVVALGGQKNDIKICNLFKRTMIEASLIAFGLSSIQIFFGKQFFVTWLGPRCVNWDFTVYYVLLANVALTGTTVVPFYVLNGSGYHRLNSGFVISSALSTIPLSIYLSPMFGMATIGYVKLISILPGIVARYIVSKRVLKIQSNIYPFYQIIPTIAGLFVCFLLIRIIDSGEYSVASNIRHASYLIGINIAVAIALSKTSALVFKNDLNSNAS